ncbi:dipeptidyl peptidase IV N-terminal region-domain-containing protein, partial [Lentinula raphanica]
IPLQFQEWSVSPSMRFLLVKVNTRLRWHHSKYGTYYVHDILTNTTLPLVQSENSSLTVSAVWAPTQDIIAFVNANNFYYTYFPFNSNYTTKVTDTGSNKFFNGVADWIYEEEVLFSNQAFWWSPDSEKIAFLTFNDSEIDEYSLPIFTPPADYNGTTFPTMDLSELHYPFPGGHNPKIQAYITSLQFSNTTLLMWPNSSSTSVMNSDIIFEALWTASHIFLIKTMSRNAQTGNLIMFDTVHASSQGLYKGVIVRSLNNLNNVGWIECEQTMYPLLSSSQGGSAYIDLLEDANGYRHIALFGESSSPQPQRFITYGSWEVTKLLSFNVEHDIVYFQAAYPSSTQRQILVSTLSGDIIKNITNIDTAAYWQAEFSPSAKLCLLSYEGPEVPFQKIMLVGKDLTMLQNIEENIPLQNLADTTKTQFMRVNSDGFILNVKEVLPPDFDSSGNTKYPVIFTISCAPSSQIVNMAYKQDWSTYLPVVMNYISVLVDCRGTGYQGRYFKSPVKDQLGHWEVVDAINTARLWVSKPYVDSSRIGIWGWSYGGYIALKVIEADAGVHSLAMAIAPVVNWRMYDSVFTERYLGILDFKRYAIASVQNVKPFEHAHVLFAHGTADINVHYDHSIHLLRMLNNAGVHGVHFESFADGDHIMGGDYSRVFELMQSFLHEKWG